VNYVNKQLRYNLLYAPKIKSKPREHRTGSFVQRSVYKAYNWAEESEAAKLYVHRRIEKIAKLTKRKNVRINKWLSRRMFRGSGKITWKRFKKKSAGSLRLKQVDSFLMNAVNNRQQVKYKTIKKLHRKYKHKTNRFNKWKFDRLKRRRFNNRAFSSRLSNALRQKVQAKALNIFNYLVTKNMVTYKTHQRHFWNYAYRRFRFQYKNYFDIVNGFFVLSLIDHSDAFLFSVLKITLPLILKIKRFFKFLNAVIKNMPELRKKYSIFKIAIAGKLAGGTKRTKSHSIGYGVLPVQTLTLAANSKFFAYTHIYGEFGVKLLTCKDNMPKQIDRWK